MSRLIEIPCEKEERAGRIVYELMREEYGVAYCDKRCDLLSCQYRRRGIA